MVSPVSASSGTQLHGRSYGQLPRDVQNQIDELAKTDREVRAHEHAHAAAAGVYAVGGPEYRYELGPDGRRYAVSGEVPIDVSEVPGDPAATEQKMNRVRRAALAPANPSPQDRQVAAQAERIAARARQEIAEERAAARDIAFAHSGTEPCAGCAIPRYGAVARSGEQDAGGVTA